ncbi:transcriptional regulator [Kingella negevensis]|uniref:transcriptional regulator n=1 Tax=Kingella negevensis TaxID=1522312 RepID=UPI00254364F0|nr:transcriptional regulator [Kingella negevensis]WII91481.1 transcriptional regulator [Kingella negevensis]WII91490.1 transcriptional regulator [Kingella negevensis]WII91499.1 transcriptional regulator [Kingella negevensis]WII91508.1 transcriptional regulator [Kingella negevensis]
MQNINNWLDTFKKRKNFKSDYQLAKYWQVTTATISQYRKERLRLPVAKCLEIAELCYCHPLEIILSLEYPRAKPSEQEIIKQIYWVATVCNATERMNARCFTRKYYKYRNR